MGYGFYQLLYVETPLQYVLPHSYSVNVTSITFTNEDKIGISMSFRLKSNGQPRPETEERIIIFDHNEAT